VFFKMFPDRLVELFQRVENTVSQGSIDPLIYKLYCILHQRLISCLSDTRGDDHCLVMLGKIIKGGVDPRLKPVAVAHGAPEIVRDRCLGRPSIIPIGPLIGANPILKILAEACFHVGFFAVPQNGHKYLHRLYLTCKTVHNRELLPCIVHKHLVPCLMLHVHGYFGSIPPHLEVVAKLGIVEALRVLFSIFFPKTVQSNPFSPQLLHKVGKKFHKLLVFGILADLFLLQSFQELTVGHLCDLLVAQPACRKIPQVPRYHRTCGFQCPGNLSLAHVGSLFEPDNVVDFLHADPLSCHSLPSLFMKW